METHGKIAAFFDLDDTIIVGTNTMYLYIKYMVKNGMMSRTQLIKGIWLSLMHKLNLVDIEKVLDDFALPYRGKREQELIDLTQQWFKTHVVSYIAADAVKKVGWHKSQNHLTAILSSATQYVCEPMRDWLGMDGSLNSQVEVVNGRFTGYLKKPLCYHKDKLHFARRFCRENNVDLSRCYFYTDSITDLPVLESVGHPVIVNPDPLLKRRAKKMGWKIESWSKVQ